MKFFTALLVAFTITQSAMAARFYPTEVRPLPEAPRVVCQWNEAEQANVCETKEYIFAIYNKQRVELTFKATVDENGVTSTGHFTVLEYQPNLPSEGAFGEEVYDNGSYRVEVGHTDGTNLFIRIGTYSEYFFYESGAF